MSRRTVLTVVLTLLILVVGFVARTLLEPGSRRSSEALAGPGTELEVPLAPSSQEPLAAAPEVRARPEPEDQREVAAPRAEREVASAIPDDALWVEGRVLLPDGLPMDEEFEVVARGRRFGAKGSSREHRARTEHDGRFRAAFAPKTRKGWLGLEARYMYLPTRLKVEPAEVQAEVLLEPLLGGIVRGVVAPPEGHEPSAEVFEGTHVNLMNWQRDPVVQLDAQPDEAGRFEFKGVPPGPDYELNVRSPEFAGVSEVPVKVKAGEVTELTGELALTPGVRLAGRVVDAAGAPLERVEVQLVASRTLPNGGRSSHSNTEKTDEDGRFEFKGLQACEAKLTIRQEGATELVDELGRLEDGEQRVDLLYSPSPGVEVSGTALWPDGTAAASVSVQAKPIEESGEVEWSAREYQTRTDEAGRFTLTGLDERALVVSVSGRRLEPPREDGKKRRKRGPTLQARVDDVQPGTRGLVLRLGLGEVLRGRVTYADGTPATHFWVEVQPDWNDRGSLEWSDRVERSFKTETGEYEVSGLPEGAWRINVRGEDFAETEDRSVRTPHEGAIDWVVQRAGRLAGVVRDPSGAPVAGAELRRERVQDEMSFWSQSESHTNSRGEFELKLVDPASYRLTASAEGFAPSTALEVTLRPGEELGDLVLVLNPPSRVTGVVLAGAGPVNNRSVSIWGGEVFTHETATTAEDGTFELTTLGPGNYQARVEPLPAEAESDWQVKNANAYVESFVLQSGGTAHVVLGGGPETPIRVSGHVRSGGAPLENYIVHLIGGDTKNEVAARTDASGAYELTVDGPGPYAATLRAGDKQMGVNYTVVQIEVSAVEEQVQDFDLPTASLTVVMTEEDGSPAAMALIGLEALDVEGLEGNVSQEQNAGEDGRFVFEHLAPGHYLLRAGGRAPWNDSTSHTARTLREVEVSAGSQGELAVQLGPGATLRGQALYPDGTPAGGRHLTVVDEAGRRVSSSWNLTDPSGGFVVEGLPAGRLTVRVDDGGPGGEATWRVGVGETLRDLRLELPRPGQ